MSELPLPALQQQILDEDMLTQLVSDICALTTVLEVRGKCAASARAATESLTLTDAMAQLRQGALRGVQVRYRYDGFIWLDTFLAAPAGIRLTRMVESPSAF